MASGLTRHPDSVHGREFGNEFLFEEEFCDRPAQCSRSILSAFGGDLARHDPLSFAGGALL